MGKKITFGKWQGWDTDDLARTEDGRNYLSWGTNNLQSSQLKAEFARALANAGQPDETLEIRAIVRANPDIDEAEAWQIVQERKSEALENERQEARMESCRAIVVQKYATLTGLDNAIIRKAIKQVETYEMRWSELPPVTMFSNPERANIMYQAYNEWMECYV